MKAYIEHIVSLDPQAAAQTLELTGETIPYVTVAEPEYNRFISPGEIRRMSRFTKLGLYTSLRCLQEAGASAVDAVTVGTGLGSFGCFEKFDQSIHAAQESGLSPTPFIHSLPNALAGQIALTLKCSGYNMTHVHRGFAFESALLDALMLLQEETDLRHILVGAVDELTGTYVRLLQQTGYAKTTSTDVAPASEGVVPGEGATFLLVSPQPSERSVACIEGVRLLFEPRNTDEIRQAVEELLTDNGLSLDQVDTVLTGRSGDARFDARLASLESDYLAGKPIVHYKTRCGEYQTATAFALWSALRSDDTTPARSQTSQRILIINQYQDANYSFLLVSRDLN
mgnify:CR=1 FL=1